MGVADPFCDARMMPVLEDTINIKNVKWSISSFEPFKSPGPDDIFPALLQHAGDILHAYLVNEYWYRLRWCDIPDA